MFLKVNGRHFNIKKGKVAHPGGKMTTNKEEATARFYKRKKIEVPKAVEKVAANSPEALRKKYVRGTLELGGCVVVADERSLSKYNAGKCDSVMKILGCIYDLTNLMDPTIAIPDEKRAILKTLIQAVLALRTDDAWVQEEVWLSLVGKLNEASKVTMRGRIHLSGLFAALRKRSSSCSSVKIDAWARRNLVWWHSFLGLETPPSSLFRAEQRTRKRFCPHSDASTSYGYGGFWIKGDTCYYIKGAWTVTEQKLIESPTHLFTDCQGVKHKMGINFLEMAAVKMLLDTAEEHGIGFEKDDFTFYCDNEATVKILNSYRSRTLPLSTLLESIDLSTERTQIHIDFEWIATDLNVESDALSRDELDEFKASIMKSYSVNKFAHLKVPEASRDIEGIVKNALKNPQWVEADGDTGADPTRACKTDGSRPELD